MNKKKHHAIQEFAKTHAIPVMLDQGQMEECYGVEMTTAEWQEFCFHLWSVRDDEVWGYEDDAIGEAFARYARRWLQRNHDAKCPSLFSQEDCFTSCSKKR